MKDGTHKTYVDRCDTDRGELEQPASVIVASQVNSGVSERKLNGGRNASQRPSMEAASNGDLGERRRGDERGK